MAYKVNDIDIEGIGPRGLERITGFPFVWKDRLITGHVYKLDWTYDYKEAVETAQKMRDAFNPNFWAVKVKPYTGRSYLRNINKKAWCVSVVKL